MSKPDQITIKTRCHNIIVRKFGQTKNCSYIVINLDEIDCHQRRESWWEA